MNDPAEKTFKDRLAAKAELISVLLLAFATVGTAWCAHQANLWNSRQTLLLADAQSTGRDSTRLYLVANQRRLLDVVLLMTYINAKSTERDQLAEFYRNRFPPRLAVAVDVWLETNPFESADAPPHPFELPQYVVEEARQSEELSQQSFESRTKAEFANSTADRYIFATVLFASVLLFAGLAPKLQGRPTRLALESLSIALFLGTGIYVLTLPVGSL